MSSAFGAICYENGIKGIQIASAIILFAEFFVNLLRRTRVHGRNIVCEGQERSKQKNNMSQNIEIQDTSRIDALFERISALIEQARNVVVSTAKVAEVKTRYEVGRYIFEDEQQGERAAYGKQVLKNLSAKLIDRFGDVWSYDTLKRCRFFYQAYENAVIGATPLPQLEISGESTENKENMNLGNDVATIRLPRFILSWSHYLILMRIENIEARSFYELQAKVKERIKEYKEIHPEETENESS